jgi:putative adhesin
MRRALVLAGLLACSGCIDLVGAHVEGRYVEREEKRFQLGGKPAVALSTFDGSIEIRPWDRTEVEVIIEKRGADKSAIGDIEVTATQTGDKIVVDVKQPHKRTGLHFGPSPSAKLIVSLPASSDVVAKSGDGSIDVERVGGRIDLRSGDGTIRARDLTGEVTVQTGDGSISLDGKFSGVRAHSGDGSVSIHAAPGTDASTDWDISTGDGSVTLEIPDGFNGELDAHTGDGSVSVEGVTVSNVTGEIRRNTVRGRLGSGGHEVRVRTGDGSIRIRRS